MKKTTKLIALGLGLSLLSGCADLSDSRNIAKDAVMEAKSSKKTEKVNYRKEMRDFVINISKFAKAKNSSFLVIPQNGQEVAWDNDDDIFEDVAPNKEYLNAIDGVGREDTFYGCDKNYNATYKKTDSEISEYFTDICIPYRDNGKAVLSTDYCNSKSNIKDSYKKNSKQKFISFAAVSRELDVIPDASKYGKEYYPYNENKNDIKSLKDAKNFLYIINSTDNNPADFIKKLQKTNYDVIIMDAFTCNSEMYTKKQIDSLKKKANGGKRLVIAYMSIGEAEDYRWYWDDSWVKDNKLTKNAPKWLDNVNEDWEGNFKVKYWKENGVSEWQNIIYGDDNSYTAKIVNAGFDGVYLDIIDGFQYYEEQ